MSNIFIRINFEPKYIIQTGRRVCPGNEIHEEEANQPFGIFLLSDFSAFETESPKRVVIDNRTKGILMDWTGTGTTAGEIC